LDGKKLLNQMAMFSMSSNCQSKKIFIIIINLIFSEQNKRSTTGDPRLAFTKDATTKDSSTHYGHQSNALQILYGMDLSNKTAIVTGANTGIGKYFISKNIK
jgi:hypothetical protein